MQFPNIVQFKVSGRHALFSDPITCIGGEKHSYPVPTYEALKGILSSVYWKPSIIWYIDKVRVIKQIKSITKGVLVPFHTKPLADLSFYNYLCDCEYQVQAHFEFNKNRPELSNDWNENKHYEIAKRMIRLGGRRDVFLGTRECQAYVEPCEFGSGTGFYDDFDEMPFGLMLHGITYADEAYSKDTYGKLTLRFWYPVMRNGIIEFCRPEKCSSDLCKTIRDMPIKRFSVNLDNFTGIREFMR